MNSKIRVECRNCAHFDHETISSPNGVTAYEVCKENRSLHHKGWCPIWELKTKKEKQ